MQTSNVRNDLLTEHWKGNMQHVRVDHIRKQEFSREHWQSFSVFSFGSIFKADDLEVIQIICREDGTDRMFRNVGQYKPDVGETPKRKHTEY
jgi:hypothetical protein